MTADIRELPLRRQITIPLLPRYKREAEFRILARDITDGAAPPSAALIELAVNAFSAPSLSHDEAVDAWGLFIARYRDWSDSYQAADWSDPQYDEERVRQALDRLLDGNDNGGIAG